MKCERCKADGFERSVLPSTLIGGFKASLCNSCLNEWHDVVSATPEWQEETAIYITETHLTGKTLAQSPVDESDWDALYRRKLENKERLFAMGREFVSSSGGST